MESLSLLRLALLASSALYAMAAEASPFGSFPAAAWNGPAPIILASPHSYRHCHNLPRRVYCHKDQALSTNWPPNSNTPDSRPREGGAPRHLMTGSYRHHGSRKWAIEPSPPSSTPNDR